MRSLFGLGAMVLAACAPVDFDDDHATPSAPPAPPDRGEPGTRPPGAPSVDAPAGPRGTVVGGLSFSCVWREDGEARCWGSNESGQLGAAPDSIEHPVAGPFQAYVSGASGSYIRPVLYLRSTCSTASSEVACAGSSCYYASASLSSSSLAAGTYYLIVDTCSSSYVGGYTLEVSQ